MGVEFTSGGDLAERSEYLSANAKEVEVADVLPLITVDVNKSCSVMVGFVVVYFCFLKHSIGTALVA